MPKTLSISWQTLILLRWVSRLRRATFAAKTGASPEGRGAPPLDALPLGDEVGVEAELWEDVDADVLDDLHHEFFDEPVTGLGEGAPPKFEESVGVDAEDVDEHDLEDGIRDEGDHPVAGASPEEWPVDDAAPQTEVSRMGYVTCKVPPWNVVRTLGRITTWPTTKKLEHRSISCKCYLHSRCKTPAKAFSEVSEAELVRWLLSGCIPAPDASSDRKQLLGIRHVKASIWCSASEGCSIVGVIIEPE